jgi:hypothetical protein
MNLCVRPAIFRNLITPQARRVMESMVSDVRKIRRMTRPMQALRIVA